MTKEEAIYLANNNYGVRVTCDELLDDCSNYITCDIYGYIKYANGEDVFNLEDLPDYGWYEYDDLDAVDFDCF